MPAAEAPSQRLFFALWPQPELARSLHGLALRVAAKSGGRVMARDTLHLTLAFLGEVAGSRLEDLKEAAHRAPKPAAFELRLDRAGYWRHNRILWVGPAAPPPALKNLAAGLAASLGEAGFSLEARPFQAHMTLIRKSADPMPLLLPDLPPWPVEEMVLVSSRLTAHGPRYRAITRWPLAAAG